MKPARRLPHWMKMKMPKGENYSRVKNIVSRNHLHTICTSGNCPNIGDCWSRGTATFMILGDICTRSCKFCAVKTGRPLAPDYDEPDRVAEAVKLMQLKHCVLTSVDRDDLDDGGAGIWAMTIKRIKEQKNGITIEALIPDFRGNKNSLDGILAAGPEIISHNLETVERLTPVIRSVAKYSTSLEVLKYLAGTGARVKSGIMAGLGETEEEIYQTMKNIFETGCRIFTIGQYLQPTFDHLPVASYIHPGKFEEFKMAGLNMGFEIVESAPLVRSSYNAEKHIVLEKD
ncbi:MAG: lipoyl synthase [Bacteroidales bacterium]|nr:lipoyl synthase [Bacteroidales bacterium]